MNWRKCGRNLSALNNVLSGTDESNRHPQVRAAGDSTDIRAEYLRSTSIVLFGRVPKMREDTRLFEAHS